MKRIWTLMLAMAVLFAPLSPVLQPAYAGSGQPAETTEDFLDKWILNGGSIGSAAGATLGQILGTVMFPGPVGWVVGSLVGGLAGGVIGTLIDNQIHKAYNYTSFDRPPLEDGGLVLEGVGPWEQAFYQIDQWVISGGAVGSLVGHFGVNLMAPFLPGPLGAFLGSYVGIFLFDAILGTLGDNLDGLIDLGKLGKEIDKAKGTDVESEAAPRAAESSVGASVSPFMGATRRAAYERYVELVRAGEGQSEEAQAAYLEYVGE